MLHEHIYQLLLDNDCVVVPGLGGFLCQYKSAQIDLKKGIILPPARTIGFNKALQQNDGLLVQSIVVTNSVSHKQAEENVRTFVNDIIQKLHQHGSVQMPKIGRLYMDDLKFIQFTPSDSLPMEETFGLNALNIQAVPRLKPVKELVESDNSEVEIPAEEGTKIISIHRPQRGWPYWIAASVAGFFLAGTIYLNSTYTDLSAGLKAGLNPKALLENVSTVAPISVLDAAKPVEVAEETEAQIIDNFETDSKYSVVVGAFKGSTRAYKYVEELTAKGYETELMGTPGEGFLKVIIHQPAVDSITALRTIRADVEPDAWLLE